MAWHLVKHKETFALPYLTLPYLSLYDKPFGKVYEILFACHVKTSFVEDWRVSHVTETNSFISEIKQTGGKAAGM
jgi:hypothetical protein